jgi:hypothetical protein
MRLFHGGRPFVAGVMIVFAARRCGADGRIAPDPSEMVKTMGSPIRRDEQAGGPYNNPTFFLRKSGFYAIENELRIESGSSDARRRKG